MAFDIPKLSDVLERTRQAFKTNLPSTDPWLWPNSIAVSAKVIAERVWEAFHRLSYVLRQAFPLTAEGEFLDRHAQTYGITRNAAQLAAGDLAGTGGTSGTSVPAGTLLRRSDGTEYIVTATATVDADGNLSVNVECLEAGVDGNTDVGAELFFATAIAGTPASMFVSTGLSGGTEEESDDALRKRLLQRLQYPPHAGSRQDYVRWASAYPGVTRVWVGRNAFGPGTVGVWFMMDDSYADGIPTAVDVAAVQAHIDDLSPVTATVTVMAPDPDPLRVEITGFHPFTPQAVADAKAEIAEAIRLRASVSTAEETAVFRRSWIWQAVANSSGEEYHTVQLPTSDISAQIGRIHVYDESFVSIEA